MNKKCQIFTPENYVEELLDCINYSENIYNKKVLENACGDGNILINIVRRYITDCIRQNLTKNQIQIGLSNDIYAYEIDKEYHRKCIINLNKILFENGLEKINWHIYNEDYLKSKTDIKFDYIISNPPYITYKEISIMNRKFLKDNFFTCKKGKYDYCYAFIEKSLKNLRLNGKMSYLIPSSIFKVASGNLLRHLIKDNIVRIDDYTTQKLFDNALVASAVIVIDTSIDTTTILYNNIVDNSQSMINKNTLGERWVFKKIKNTGLKRFGDFFNVSHSIATLLNEAYVIKTWKDSKDYYLCDGYQIEKATVKEAAAPRRLAYGKKELIIFPYRYINGELKRYTENEFEQQFPQTTAFLNRLRVKLEKRNIDSHANWFEYGRSQALSSLNTEKVLLSTIITKKIKLYRLPKDCIPYAGVFIQQKGYKYSLEDAVNILTSQNFLDYAYSVGININGISIRITSKDIKEYRF